LQVLCSILFCCVHFFCCVQLEASRQIDLLNKGPPYDPILNRTPRADRLSHRLDFVHDGTYFVMGGDAFDHGPVQAFLVSYVHFVVPEKCSYSISKWINF